MSDEIRNDPEARRILTEEEKTLTRVREALAALTKTHVRKDYDAELLELRDAVNEARMEDVPALLAEMERLRNVASRRAEVVTGAVNVASPYFGHMKLMEGGRVRDVLIGNGTYVDIAGLCKVATHAEIAAQGWSLNPGRYTGSAASDESDEDFTEHLESLYEEFTRLSDQAAELRTVVDATLQKILDA